jgi:beta-1,4-N-acetylglucosaminyltransferase
MSGWVEHRRTCLAYSSGGHRTELERALAGITFTDCFHVTFPSGREAPTGVTVHHVCHPRRSFVRTAINALQSFVLLLRLRPRLIISTGADVAVPILILGKLLGVTTIFIETGGTIEPSLAGRLCYPFSDLFIVQWPDKLTAFPDAVLSCGPLL